MLKGRRKLVIVAAVILLGIVAYSQMKPQAKATERIKGTVYALPQSFLLNLSGGRYAKLNVALVLAPGQSAGDEAAAKPSNGETAAGTLPEEAVVRSIITNAVTGQNSSTLVDEHGRAGVEQQILRAIDSQTDIKVKSVLFPDLTVQ
jgi:flagellar FliL protein